MPSTQSSPLPANVFAVILAGGSGTRFWPKSRHNRPKQLCQIGDNDFTMIELTLRRLDGLVPANRRIVVTHVDQLSTTVKMTTGLCDHYLAEPAAKNTANALALAALEIELLAKEQGIENPIMLSLHADALIKRMDVFVDTIKSMVASAAQGYLTLLGITPEYPETGYGYMEKGNALPGLETTYKVSSFREKPDAKVAAEYIATKRFLWNSGIFAWQISTILDELKTFVPQSIKDLSTARGQHSSFAKIPKELFSATYQGLKSIAIDPAVLEKSSKVSVVEADIGWKDVGSWDALALSFPTDAQNNLFYGDVIQIDSEGTTVDSDAKLVACIGVKDMIIVCSEGSILVCPKERAQDVKYIVEELKKRGRTDLV
ncbi:MAG: mannose-1-phosphate guanylyltransferase [Chitinophagaceae bacterium]|nr:mannose-1-phosphate guanylyltransferase [Oligoflexus sp.]